MLALAVERYGWRLLGFCLMPNHVHLIIETPEPNLGAGMQWLHSLYAVTFNERHGRRGEGHVFQGPYGSKRILDDLYFLRVAAYVLGNAPAAGLCARPEDWPWCSLTKCSDPFVTFAGCPGRSTRGCLLLGPSSARLGGLLLRR